MKNNFVKFIKAALVAAFWILAWHIISAVVAREILVPSPARTLEAFFMLAKTQKFWNAVVYSIVRIIIGFIMAMAAGTLGAILSYRFKFFEFISSPILSLVRTIPVASFIILALVWIKSDVLPLFISFFTVTPIIWDTVLAGIRNTKKAALEAASVDGAGKWSQLFYIIIPGLAPSFFSAAVTGLGFAWKSGVAAEVICRPKFSIGSMLQDAKTYIESPELFALTATVIILSLIIEKVLKSFYQQWSKKHIS
jgi:NitT/TauT family transport system permease protein